MTTVFLCFAFVGVAQLK